VTLSSLFPWPVVNQFLLIGGGLRLTGRSTPTSMPPSNTPLGRETQATASTR
jgi:hypothetical protein